MFPARMRRTGLLGLAGTLALSPVITPALAQTPTPTPLSTPSASPSPTDTTLPAATPEPVATEAPQESQAPPTATSQEPAAPVTPSASPSSTPVTSTTPRPANTPVASTSPRVSAAVAVPALTIAAPTCTGPCAPAGWAAGYGNYRLTGTTTAPAGSIVDVAVVIDGVRIGTIASATVSAAGIWTTTYPTNRAGSVLFVATVRGTTATAQTAPVTVSAPAIVMSTKAYSADTMKGTPVRGQLTTRMPNQKVRLMVWVYVKSEGISRWSLSQNLTTDATGSFNTRLAFDNGSVRTLTWQVETAYPNIPRSYATVFTERKFALIDFVTSPVTASMVPVSSLLLARLCNEPIEAVTGVGTGLDAAGLARKVEVLRQVLALQRCAGHLAEARAHAAAGDTALDLFAEELRLAHEALGEITGTFTSDDLLGEIFAGFCIGK